MKRLSFIVLALTLVLAKALAGNVVSNEGAWCWFADSRALHYENASATINATYVGYIDVHGNVKATQYDWLKGRKTDVLVRSYFQPDDHNNPTFLVLPDERIMIFYTRHTDEPCIWYRVSTRPGDITALGEEKRLATQNNTTYPSPFILSDDPQHIYLCWRGINWHPTIARLTMPDAADDCHFDFGPKQIVQSTGARPYAKYMSNGKDKIYVAYTTGHPDNEMPNWLYFNVIDINKGQGPVLRDLNGKQLSIINNGVFNVNKTDAYATSHPATIVDKTASVRNWVWQIALDEKEHPVIAYTHIDDAKTTHDYWHANWDGTKWVNTWVQHGGHAFHQNWNSTEKCYSGGMALDPDNTHTLYVSMPTKNGQYNKDGVYEICKYDIADGKVVGGSETFVTSKSQKNNMRPFVIPGSKNSPMRVTWMQGDYYYWMVNKNYPKGYPTAILCNYDWQEPLTAESEEARTDCICLNKNKTVTLAFELNKEKYEGTLFTVGNEDDANGRLTYGINATDQRPELSLGGNVYRSQNRLLTSDDWAKGSTGTSGDNHPTKHSTLIVTLTYDGQVLTIYRNGLADQVIESDKVPAGTIEVMGETSANGSLKPFNHKCIYLSDYYACASPITVQRLVKGAQDEIKAIHNQSLPKELKNGDFEGAYAPMQGSGVKADRAIYLPEGWTIDYAAPNENDLTALKAGDLYFSNFFASRPKPSADSKQTYWVRQNWGSSTITLKQEMLLPAGKYQLTASVWKSGLGGDAFVGVQQQDGPTITAPSMENKEAWQQASLVFESNGTSSTTVALTAMHNYNGTEKIIGFDNVKLTLDANSAIQAVENNLPHNHATFDLQGRRLTGNTHQKGLYIQDGKKLLAK